jgi:branched-chain amino acid transport system ATP-binding protein
MILEVRNLATGYKDVKVVHDVNVSVEAGTVSALLGRNGAGKTTTLHAISGLLPVTKGNVILDGVDITSVKPSKRAGLGISLVQEGKRVFKSLSVEQNLAMGAYSRRMSRAELEARKESIFTRLPALTVKRNAIAGSLSGGQQQMLAIGQALMAAPKVLLLDEPSAGLAPAITGQIFDIIVQLRDEGMGVLLVEQSVEFALACATRVTVVNLGRNIYDGTSDDPVIRDRIASAFMGDAIAG